MRELAVLVLLAAGIAACGATQTRSASLAVDRMATVRCERTRACGAPADNACIMQQRAETTRQLGLSRCLGEIREEALARCLDGLRRAACDDRDPTLVRACTVGEICVARGDEGSI